MTFFDALVRYETDLWNHVDAHLRQHDQVGLAQLEALRVIGRTNDLGRVQDVADGLSITPGAASKFVDRLTRDGMVRRVPNPQDRRSALVTLTSAGADRLSTGDEIAEAAVRAHVERSGTNVDDVTDALRRLRLDLRANVEVSA